MNNQKYYKSIARLFEYPEALYAVQAKDVQILISEAYPETAAALESFLNLLPGHDLRMMQELFTRSFDVQAVTTLDIGYVLFGDDYKRGELLSNLNREHNMHNVDCGHELADHLPNVLKLIAVLEDEELLSELIEEIVAPALHKMESEFDDKRIDSKHEAYRKHYKTLIESPSDSRAVATLFQYPLAALVQMLKKDFGIVQRITLVEESDFLGSLSKENEIEEKANAFY